MHDTTCLSVKGLTVYYGKTIRALADVSLDVRQGEIVAVLGANGAGKSSLLRTISGLVKPQSGSAMLGDVDLTRIVSHKVLAHGVAHVPEGRMIIPHFTVRENLMAGAHIVSARVAAENMAWITEMFPILRERIAQSAGTLSGGEQQMLAIGRALMSDPKILLLDEPSLGLAPIIVDRVMALVRDINKTRGVTIMLVEQNAYMALETSDRAYVLENGSITMSGPSADLLRDEELKKRYLAG
jgi:branched-chain amino acid transport system ATP-binding protein